MSEADKMLLNVGFKKEYDKDNAVCYYKNTFEIQFDKKYKVIDFYNDSGEELWGNTIYDSVTLNMQELKAINKKVEELGWNE